MAGRTSRSREAVLRAQSLLQRARTVAELRAAQSVLFVTEYGLSLRQTAAMLGCSVPTVSRLRHWLKTAQPNVRPARPQWGGRRRQNLSLEEERRLLNSFKGQAIAIRALWQAYETKLGRSVPDSTIYRLLRRHGCRKAARGAYHSKGAAAS
jgi:transposase